MHALVAHPSAYCKQHFKPCLSYYKRAELKLNKNEDVNSERGGRDVQLQFQISGSLYKYLRSD
jgi:hypothetical protein